MAGEAITEEGMRKEGLTTRTERFPMSYHQGFLALKPPFPTSPSLLQTCPLPSPTASAPSGFVKGTLHPTPPHLQNERRVTPCHSWPPDSFHLGMLSGCQAKGCQAASTMVQTVDRITSADMAWRSGEGPAITQNPVTTGSDANASNSK